MMGAYITGSETIGLLNGASSMNCYKDLDGDLYSDGTIEVVSSCSSDYYEAGDLTATSGDCDDNNANIQTCVPPSFSLGSGNSSVTVGSGNATLTY